MRVRLASQELGRCLPHTPGTITVLQPSVVQIELLVGMHFAIKAAIPLAAEKAQNILWGKRAAPHDPKAHGTDGPTRATREQ